MKLLQRYSWIKWLLVYGTVVFCTAVLISLCFNEGLDYDESFSFSIVHDNKLGGIAEGILASPYNDVIPLWYIALKIWTCILGEKFFVCKMFTVAGSLATMLLGATVVRKNWGCKTALLFIIPAGLGPGLMHVGVNIRTYSWTVFIVTACALIAHSIVRNSGKRKLWVLLFVTTVAGLLCHHFTAFSYFFIYLYLFIELLRYDRKSLWKMFVCGITSLIPFVYWLVISGFLQMKDVEGGQLSFAKIKIYAFWEFVFQTNIPWSKDMGVCIFLLMVALFILLRKRFEKKEYGFILLCLFSFLLSYLMSAIMSSVSAHFIAERHTMHTVALIWLGIAIMLPRVNKAVYVSGLLYVIAMCGANYQDSYRTEYNTIPYLEETKEFIADNMQPGDIVIYNTTEEMYHTLYGCYMTEQEFLHFPEIDDADIQELAGKRVWFALSRPDFFTEEQQQKYGITYENKGHYGFQIIADCTDFDLLWVEIKGAAQ